MISNSSHIGHAKVKDLHSPFILTRLNKLPVPKPRVWLWDNLIPAGHISLWRGKGGDYKSTTATAFTLHVAEGHDFLGRTVTKADQIVYLDFELDGDEFYRRAAPLANGMGLAQLPDNIFYSSVREPLINEERLVGFVKLMNAMKVGLVVVDSFGFAAAGIDMNAYEQVIKFMKALEGLGCTCIVIDHQPKNGDTAFGSVYKTNLARSELAFKKQGKKEGRILIDLVKHQFGPAAKLCLAFEGLGSDTTTVKLVTGWDGVSTEALDSLDSLELAIGENPGLTKRAGRIARLAAEDRE